MQVYQASKVGNFCGQILRRGIDSCFFAWKGLAESLRAEVSLCADIDDVARSLSHQVCCLCFRNASYYESLGARSYRRDTNVVYVRVCCI
jgi:hypothetical protein